ncbi:MULTISPECIES: DUF411 domain-containing protein [Pseudoalteromonas]|uniref:Metal-binding protein n=1 Tax=Pseudoalteromonas ruthenica TaxID=151081 RepID=A0A0F4PQ43_9GAMM|nr:MULTISPECIES: DUF411 domain-containing protein [Pseudoalteromonas]KJY97158.1 metal-binding protein [Pseudoalteromonas ruthenica]KJY99470.1 metal-binding protein [Pseudoalteromonas ruthenica]TMO86834.1 metal-binding protein [Pseudoalteromonas ruthenica]TMO93452.1 metal-binding protein [Pseudoalteromonas ruthenica]TMO96452.1 metal-binding protein [Pseudoalteromonas ruthenica]
MFIKRNSTVLAMLFSVSVPATDSQEQQLTVLKDPNCGCCEQWLKALPDGFSVSVQHPNNLTQRKRDSGISAEVQSCHTAISNNGYVFEGHVPPTLVAHYLAGKKSDNGIGLTVPGMPLGSIGMEMGTQFQPYTVYEIKSDGSITSYRQIVSLERQKALSKEVKSYEQ